MKKPLKVVVVGTGYVGLTTGACFAKLGHEVLCADIIPGKVAMLQEGIIPIVEDGLEPLVRDGLKAGTLRFILGAKAAVAGCDFAFMCLPTPQGADGSADLSYVLEAAKELGPLLPKGAIVVNKSTVPVGSAELVADALGRDDVFVASNPEFLREGTAVHDFFEPDRIVIGAQDKKTAQKVAALYGDIDAPKLLVDTATAELIKYASNAFLAAKISFANSIANLCEAVGANAHDVLAGMGADNRIGPKFLKPGPGWGGSCFPKDTYALINIAESAGYDFGLLKAVISANDVQTALIVDKVHSLMGGQIAGARIAAWGVAFKAGTDDTRESPALRVLQALVKLGASVKAYDPGVTKPPQGVELGKDALSVCEGADILIVLTEWPEFAAVPLDEVAELLSHKRLVDTRNMIRLDTLELLGYEYMSVGYGARKAVAK